MSRLEASYGDQVDFVHIDWDDPDAREAIAAFAVPRRSTYILLGPDGSIRWTFVGLLDADVVAGEIEKALETGPSPSN